jgi:cytochrome c oxidase subunit 2
MRSDAHVVSPQDFQSWMSKLQSGGGAAQAGGGGAPAGGAAGPDGKALFANSGCAGCHTLAAAGASGTVGPNLDKAIPSLTPAFIKQSIEDPNAKIAPGYSANIMPADFKQRLGDNGVNAVVQYLKKVAKP